MDTIPETPTPYLRTVFKIPAGCHQSIASASDPKAAINGTEAGPLKRNLIPALRPVIETTAPSKPIPAQTTAALSTFRDLKIIESPMKMAKTADSRVAGETPEIPPVNADSCNHGRAQNAIALNNTVSPSHPAVALAEFRRNSSAPVSVSDGPSDRVGDFIGISERQPLATARCNRSYWIARKNERACGKLSKNYCMGIF